jgi:phytoene desaturase
VLSGAYHHTETLLIRNTAPILKSIGTAVFCTSSHFSMLVLIKNRKYFASCVVFDTDFTKHAKDIYDEPRWPDEPLFYANFPSITDKSAVEGMESVLL